MSRTTRVCVLAGAAALTVTGAGVAGPASETTQDDLARRLAAAEAKIASMEAANNQTWLTEQRAAEIRGLVQDVLADADTRASLLQTGITAGYDNGAVISSSDGNYLIRTNFHMQQRFIWNNQDDGDSGLIDTNRYGFENTRSKFIITGNVVNPDWYYQVNINVGDGNDRTGTGEAFLGHDYGNGWKIQMGTFKAPLLREELVQAQYQLTVERSIVNYLFTAGYVDGLAAMYEGDQFRFAGMLSDGAGSGHTIWSTYDTEYALTGRVEWLVNGNWEQFKDHTNGKDGESGVMIGGAAHFQEGEFGTSAVETETTILTADASLEFSGANAFASLVWLDTDTPGVTADSNPLGFVIQGGFYLNDTWELFGRYEFTDFDVSGAEDLSIITVGVNKYFAGHNAKWTTDIGFGLETVPVAANITGWRPDLTTEDGQVVVRTQWQILF